MATVGEIFNRYIANPVKSAGRTVGEALQKFNYEYPSIHEKSSYLAEKLTPYAVPQPLRQDLPMLAGIARQELAKRIHGPEDIKYNLETMLNLPTRSGMPRTPYYPKGTEVGKPGAERYLSETRSEELEQEMKSKLFDKAGIKPLAREYFKTIPVSYGPEEGKTYGAGVSGNQSLNAKARERIERGQTNLQKFMNYEQSALDAAKNTTDPELKKQYLDSSRYWAGEVENYRKHLEEDPYYKRSYAEQLLNPTIMEMSEITINPTKPSEIGKSSQVNEADQLRIFLHEYIHTTPRTIYPFEPAQREWQTQFKKDFQEAFAKTKSLQEVGLIKRGFTGASDLSFKRLKPYFPEANIKGVNETKQNIPVPVPVPVPMPTGEGKAYGQKLVGGKPTLETVYGNEEEMFADIGSMFGPSAIDLPIIGKYYEPIFEKGKGQGMEWLGDRILKAKRNAINVHKQVKEGNINLYPKNADKDYETMLKGIRSQYELGRPYSEIIEEERRKIPGMRTVGEILQEEEVTKKKKQEEEFQRWMESMGKYQ
jgi:hypothetical protein